MKINFLGTGTSQAVPVIGCDCPVCKSTNPKDHRLRTSVLVELDDQNILIDIGPDFRQQMLRSGIDDIDAILLTHEHADHIGGFDDIRPINFKWKKTIPMFGLPRTIASVKSMYHYAFAKDPYPGVPRIELEPVNTESFDLNGQEVEALPLKHGSLDILGFKINDFVYITDANAIPDETLDRITSCDTLVINALRESDHRSHFSLSEAIEQIKIIQPKSAFIIHMSHRMGKHDDVETRLPQNVYLAYDGLSIDIQ